MYILYILISDPTLFSGLTLFLGPGRDPGWDLGRRGPGPRGTRAGWDPGRDPGRCLEHWSRPGNMNETHINVNHHNTIHDMNNHNNMNSTPTKTHKHRNGR